MINSAISFSLALSLSTLQGQAFKEGVISLRRMRLVYKLWDHFSCVAYALFPYMIILLSPQLLNSLTNVNELHQKGRNVKDNFVSVRVSNKLLSRRERDLVTERKDWSVSSGVSRSECPQERCYESSTNGEMIENPHIQCGSVANQLSLCVELVKLIGSSFDWWPLNL